MWQSERFSLAVEVAAAIAAAVTTTTLGAATAITRHRGRATTLATPLAIPSTAATPPPAPTLPQRLPVGTQHDRTGRLAARLVTGGREDLDGCILIARGRATTELRLRRSAVGEPLTAPLATPTPTLAALERLAIGTELGRTIRHRLSGVRTTTIGARAPVIRTRATIESRAPAATTATIEVPLRTLPARAAAALVGAPASAGIVRVRGRHGRRRHAHRSADVLDDRPTASAAGHDLRPRGREHRTREGVLRRQHRATLAAAAAATPAGFGSRGRARQVIRLRGANLGRLGLLLASEDRDLARAVDPFFG